VSSCHTLMADVDSYGPVLILLLIAAAMSAGIVAASRLIGPRRGGPTKDSPYESGVAPTGDARQRFNVRFYVIAMLFLLFDVEVVFFWPWAPLYGRVSRGPEEGGPTAAALIEAGYDKTFLLATMGIFLLILLIGYLYAWRKGVLRWS